MYYAQLHYRTLPTWVFIGTHGGIELTVPDPEAHETSSKDMREKSRRTTMIAAVSAVAVAAVVIILILAFASTPIANPTTPYSGLHLDVTKPPPNVPPYCVVLGFVEFTRSITWSEVRLDLTNADGAVSWYPSTEELSGSAFVSQCCGSGTLGNMTVTCNIKDVLGDGAPHCGDTVNLTATSDSTFLATQNYTISAIYLPTGGLICRTTFNGVPLTVSY